MAVDYRTSGIKLEALLWIVAVVLMFTAAAYQRRTGPTYPVRGSFEVAGQTYRVQARVCLESSGDAKDVRVHIVQVLDHWPSDEKDAL